MLVAFSGGVDSSLLLAAAVRALGSKAVAATARSELYPGSELEQARRVARGLGLTISSSTRTSLGFRGLPPIRQTGVTTARESCSRA